MFPDCFPVIWEAPRAKSTIDFGIGHAGGGRCAPMWFLDHRLRCGDSLFGELVAPAERELAERYKLVGIMLASPPTAGRNIGRSLRDSQAAGAALFPPRRDWLRRGR